MLRNKTFTTLILVFYTFSGSAQQPKIDSLHKLLASQKNDTNKVNTLYELSTQYVNKDEGKRALVYANQGLSLSEQLGYKKGKAGALGTIGNIATIEGDYNKAIEKHSEALKIRDELNDKPGIVKSYFSIARAYSYLENYPLSVKYHLLSLALAEELRDKPFILKILTSLAYDYFYQEEFLTTIKYLERALLLTSEVSLSSDRSIVYISLSNAYLKYGDLKKAFEMADQSLKLNIADQDTAGMAEDYLTIAKIYEGWGDTSLASGNVETSGKNYAVALNNFLDAEKMVQVGDDSVMFELGLLSDLYADIGSFYVKLVDLQKAERYLNNSLRISKRLNWYDNLKNSYRGLYRLDSAKKDYQNAFRNYQLYIYYKETTSDKKNLAKAESSRMQYEFDKKEATAKAEQAKKDAEAIKTRNLQYSAIGFFLLLAVFLTWNNRQQQKAKKKIGKAFIELKMTQAQLVQSEKMASLGELTAGIAHEIQNPLNFVNNFSEVSTEMVDEMTVAIKNGDKVNTTLLASELKENLVKITHHGKRAGAIVKSMLQHSRTSSTKRELTDINAMVEEYLRLSYHGLRAKDKNFQAKFETELDPQIGQVNLVAQDIGRVLLNLINNAFYAVTEKQQQQVAGFDPAVFVKTKKSIDGVSITVQDNGNGIHPNILDKIFQPFFTTKPTGQGTGLGLSLSYDIVKAHGGELKVETTEGEGSRFIISLPLNSAS